MGRVYLGRSAAGRLVAVKTIKVEYAEEADFRARFAAEVAAAGRVSGVFTAAVIAADAEADVPWLATAYVPAPALDELVAGCGPLPVPAVRWLAAGCAEAVESIHAAGLVHRDLKPSNVLVGTDGPRVIDFGVARAAERIQLTTTHGSIGTPAYMAPEQARDTKQATMASDMFSLGSTLLFAATGHAPYQGETVMDILVRIATEPPDLTGLPRDLVDLVAGCLERAPADRPTPGELIGELAPYLDGSDGGGYGPAPLPAAARALIEEYRQEPQPPLRAVEPAGAETTFGSGSVPAAQRVVAATPRPVARRRRFGGRSGWPVGRRGAVLPVVGVVGAVIALVVLGGLLGSWVGNPSAPPAETRIVTISVPEGRPGPPPDGGPQPPAGAQGQHPDGKPRIQVNQPTGDRATVFVLHGRGWTPGQEMTVSLAGRPASRVRPVVDRAGTFNYAINQQYEFFRGPLPIGDYRVIAVPTTGGPSVEATFTVHD